eukprot:8090382-Pyramimonas_sp.AAC.1
MGSRSTVGCSLCLSSRYVHIHCRSSYTICPHVEFRLRLVSMLRNSMVGVYRSSLGRCGSLKMRVAMCASGRLTSEGI